MCLTVVGKVTEQFVQVSFLLPTKWILRNRTEVVWLCGKHLFLLSHLTGPCSITLFSHLITEWLRSPRNPIICLQIECLKSCFPVFVSYCLGLVFWPLAQTCALLLVNRVPGYFYLPSFLKGLEWPKVRCTVGLTIGVGIVLVVALPKQGRHKHVPVEAVPLVSKPDIPVCSKAFPGCS